VQLDWLLSYLSFSGISTSTDLSVSVGRWNYCCCQVEVLLLNCMSPPPYPPPACDPMLWMLYYSFLNELLHPLWHWSVLADLDLRGQIFSDLDMSSLMLICPLWSWFVLFDLDLSSLILICPLWPWSVLSDLDLSSLILICPLWHWFVLYDIDLSSMTLICPLMTLVCPL